MLHRRAILFQTLCEAILRKHLNGPKVVVSRDIVIVLGLSLASFRKFLNLLFHVAKVLFKSCVKFESLLLLFIIWPAVVESALLLLEVMWDCFGCLQFLPLK